MFFIHYALDSHLKMYHQKMKIASEIIVQHFRMNEECALKYFVLVPHLQETITLFEKEVVIDQFLLNFFGHTGKWVVGTFKFTTQTIESLSDLSFHFFVLGLCQARVEWISLKVDIYIYFAPSDNFVIKKVPLDYSMNFVNLDLNYFIKIVSR